MRRALAIALLVAMGGCEQKAPEPNGIAEWQLGISTLRDAQTRGRCQPQGELTWCFGSRTIGMGSQAATVQLYFGGLEPTATLVEIAMSVRACNKQEVADALAKVLGQPGSRDGNRLFWEKKLMFVSADLDAGGRCDVSFVEPTDTKRVRELMASPAAPAPKAEPAPAAAPTDAAVRD